MIETRSTRTATPACWLILLSLAAGTMRAETPRSDLDFKRERQKQVQADTEQTVRRVGTMLRVLDYYQLDKRAERQLLEKAAGTLAGLSREQMNEVIARLEAAAKAADEKHVQSETEGAYVRHREIVQELKKLLARYDAVKGLDQAAKQLEQMARKQHELSLRGSQMAQEWRRTSDVPGPQGQKTHKELQSEIRHAGDDQGDLKREAASVLAQIARLRAQLPPEQQQRLSQAEAQASRQQVLDRMEKAAEALTSPSKEPVADLQASITAQRQAAESLQELARTLRTPLDRLAALREAHDRITAVVQSQEGLRRQAENAAREPRTKESEQRAREMGDRQGRLEHAARNARSLLAPEDQDVGKRIAPAERSMRQAEDTLRKNDPAHAAEPQAEAARTLRQVQKELEDRIAAAEKERGDPLEALKKSVEQVDRLIEEQKDLRDKAAEADRAGKPQRLSAMTGKQQDLARRTEQLNHEHSASKAETRAALEKAAESMQKASEDLQGQKGKESVARQDEAIRDLEKARKDLAEQAAMIEKRRQEIADLEKVAKRLDELVKEQGKVTKTAEDKAKSDAADTKDVARQQGALEPQAKEVGKQIEQAAPDAANKVADASKNMEAARGDLEKNQARPGADKAKAAGEQLKEAQKAVARALNEKRGADLAEQAALQADRVDAANAADQIAKALEQTQQAAAESDKAAERLGSKAKTPDLAKLQKQVAEQTGKVDAGEAHKPAAEAAEALQKGDLTSAVEQQKKALEQLEKTAAKKGEANAEARAEGTPSPAEARNAAELAKAQKGLLEATKALARSREATQEAQAALAQAQAQAPQGLQDELQKAGAELNRAEQQLQAAAPTPAHASQQAAAAQLSKAMKSMNAALAAMGQQPGQSQAVALGQKPGQGKSKGQTPGKAPGQGKAKEPSEERNGSKSNGDRIANGKMGNGESRLLDVAGAGSFLHLPPRQREMIRQALTSKLPAQYAAMIQQYYINIAGGKPAAPAVKPARP